LLLVHPGTEKSPSATPKAAERQATFLPSERFSGGPGSAVSIPFRRFPPRTILALFAMSGLYRNRCIDAATISLIYDESLARNHTRIMEARPE
jgi:hypothetical protein